MEFQDKVVVVTGGTSGIGLACAKMFEEHGAQVVLSGHSEEHGQEALKELKHGCFIRHDAASEEDAKRLVEETIRQFGRIDVLFNNAGVCLPSMEIERMPVEDWEETFDVNVSGYFYVCRYAKPYLVQSHGTIINNASIAGLHSYVIGRSYAYSASKAAVIQFSRQMAKNYAEEGVRVNCICPGIIDTKILGDRNRAEYAKRVPLGYLGAPEDVAKVVLFLAGDGAAYLVGTVIPVDGGVSL